MSAAPIAPPVAPPVPHPVPPAPKPSLVSKLPRAAFVLYASTILATLAVTTYSKKHLGTLPEGGSRSRILTIDLSLLQLTESPPSPPPSPSNPLALLLNYLTPPPSAAKPSPLSLETFLHALALASLDDTIAGVHLKVPDVPDQTITTYTAHAIKQALGDFRRAKGAASAPVYTSATFPQTSQALYLLLTNTSTAATSATAPAAARTRFLHPMGTLPLSLLAPTVETFYLKGFLDKLGIKPEILRRGKYKSAASGPMQVSARTRRRRFGANGAWSKASGRFASADPVFQRNKTSKRRSEPVVLTLRRLFLAPPLFIPHPLLTHVVILQHSPTAADITSVRYWMSDLHNTLYHTAGLAPATTAAALESTCHRAYKADVSGLIDDEMGRKVDHVPFQLYAQKVKNKPLPMETEKPVVSALDLGMAKVQVSERTRERWNGRARRSFANCVFRAGIVASQQSACPGGARCYLLALFRACSRRRPFCSHVRASSGRFRRHVPRPLDPAQSHALPPSLPRDCLDVPQDRRCARARRH